MDPRFFRKYADLITEAEQRLGVEVIGKQGVEPYQIPFRKRFNTQEEFEAWKAANEKHGDVEITSTRILDTTQQAPTPDPGPDNREMYQLFHGRGSDQGQPLRMTKDKALRFAKDSVMQQRLTFWGALVDSSGKVIWTWDPNGFLPARFSSGYDTKPLPDQYAQYDQMPGYHTSTVHNLIDTNEGEETPAGNRTSTGDRTSKRFRWMDSIKAKYPNVEFSDPRKLIPKNGDYHIVATVNGREVGVLVGNLFRDKAEEKANAQKPAVIPRLK